jgi:geranylgeranyl pyrophosphate synthase
MTVTEDFIAEVRGEVDQTLDKLLPAADVAPANLHEAIRWSVFAGGKRVRPMIVIAAGETFSRRERLLRTAAAIEMVHTYC